MTKTLSRMPFEYTQKTDIRHLIGCAHGMTDEPYHALVVSPSEVKTHVNSFEAYRGCGSSATDLRPIPTMVVGGYYGKRAPVKHAVEPEDPIETVRRAMRAMYSLPTTNCLLEQAAREHEAATVTIDAQLAAFRKAVSLLKRFAPVTLASFTAGPIDKWTARLEGFATLKKGWDSYRAEPPAKNMLIAAGGFLDILRDAGMEPSKMNPSVVGGVGFTFRHGQRSVYIEFRNTGNIHAAFIGTVPEPDVVKVAKNRRGYAAILDKVKKHLYEQAACGNANERPTA